MARLKHLFVAVLTVALGAYYLHARAETDAAQIRQAADERLKAAPAAVAGLVGADGQALSAQAKGLQLGGLAETMDDEGKPTAEALEAARTAIEKSLPTDAERPAMVVVAAQGVGGRYRLGQSNRFDKDLSAFPALTMPGPLPRSGIGILDGELCRFVITQFDDTKVENAKGLVALAYPLDDGFAKRLQAAAGGVEVLLLEKDKTIGATPAPAERQALQAAAATNKGLFDVGTGSSGASAGGLPLPLFAKPARYRASVLSPVAGLPADIKIVVATRTLERYASLADAQQTLLGIFAALAILSLLLMILSGNPVRGLARVASAGEKLSQGDHAARAPTDKMSPLVRRVAVVINNLAGQVNTGPTPAGPSFAEQLGIKAPRSGPSLPPPPPPEEHEPLPPAPEFPAPTETFRSPGGLSDVDSFLTGAASDPTSVVVRAPPPSPATVPSPRATGLAGTAAPAPVSTSFAASPAASSSFPASSSIASPISVAKPKAVVVSAPPPSTAPMYQEPAEDEFGHDQTVIAQTPEALIRATQRSTSFPSPPSSPPSAVPLPPPAVSSEEAHFQQVYKDFVTTREKCHEPADGLTFDKFAQKLRKNQEQLVQKYQCRTVKFQVYVKDGKAALKATPVR